jgi:hypothetical protein
MVIVPSSYVDEGVGVVAMHGICGAGSKSTVIIRAILAPG